MKRLSFFLALTALVVGAVEADAGCGRRARASTTGRVRLRDRGCSASPADGDMRRDGIAVVDAGELPPLPRRCRRGEPFGRLSSVAGRFAHLAGWPDLDEVGF